MADKTFAPLPPQNLEAEEYVLGAMMLSPTAIERCLELVGPGDFYRETHGRIFQACVDLYVKGSAVDAVTVAEHLDALGDLEHVGGKDRIREIATLVPVTTNAPHHAAIVRELAIHRDLVHIGIEITDIGHRHGRPSNESLEEAERLVFELSQARSRRQGDLVSAKEAASETFALLNDLAAHKRELLGLPTGYQALDQLTSGFRPGQLVVVAGRPSMGKSAWLLCMIAHLSLHRDPPVPVALFSMEMSRLEVMQRIVSSEALIASQSVQNPSRLGSEEWGRIARVLSGLETAPFFIDESGASTLPEIRAKARRWKLRHPGPALVAIDYVQLMGSGDRRENRNQELSLISRALKMLATELQSPVVILSQLSRDVERRHDKRPILSDLRDSGSLEQDADVVMMLYRDEYYFPEETENAGIAEVQIAKQRNGPTGMRKLSFQSRFARYGDLAGEL